MKKIKSNKYVKGGIITTSILFLLSFCLGLFSSLLMLESFRIVFGSVFVLFLPGLIISFIFFPKIKEFDSKNKDSGSIDWIERVALSFALSIAIVPLVVFYLNLAGVKINLFNSSLIIVGIIVIASGILYWKNQHK
jgi:uncharacterized membrane protein